MSEWVSDYLESCAKGREKGVEYRFPSWVGIYGINWLITRKQKPLDIKGDSHLITKYL